MREVGEMGSGVAGMGQKLFGTASQFGDKDANGNPMMTGPPTTSSVLGGLGKIAGGVQQAGAGQQPRQASAQPVNFAMPNQPYIPPPQTGGGMSNQFYGG